MVPAIREALEQLSPNAPRFLINTHWHGDHVGGNALFGECTPIVAHTNVRARMAKGSPGDRGTPPAKPRAMPVLTFDDAITLHFNGEEIEVRHIGASHTDGDSIVWFKKSNVVHMGDAFFDKRFPFVDLDSEGSVRGLTQEIAKLLAGLPANARLIPGHGPLASVADLEGYHAMLVESRKLVASALAAGKNAATMKQEKLLSSYASWSWVFISAETFIDILVRDAGLK